jgi:LacI family transcriptional regulator
MVERMRSVDTQDVIKVTRDSRIKRVGIVIRPTTGYLRGVVNGILEFGLQKEWEHILLPAEVPELLEAAQSRSIDGIIGHLSEQQLLDELGQVEIPAVDISSDRLDTKIPSVISDETAVGRMAAEYLLSLGLPQFAFVGSAVDYTSLARFKGFEEVLKTAGRPWHEFLHKAPSNETLVDVPPPNELLSWAQSLPTPIGVFSSTDSIGLQFVAACKKLNISVPKSAAVLGAGNDDLLCLISNPPLSSILFATQNIGFNGAKLLSALMEGKTPPKTTILIPPIGVIPRQSSELIRILDRDVAAAVSYISLHAKNQLRVEDIVREISVSRSSLDQRFLKALGYTPATAIQQAKIELAKKLLADTQEPMSRVATSSGFHNAKQLTVTFRRVVGVAPTVFRSQVQRPIKQDAE